MAIPVLDARNQLYGRANEIRTIVRPDDQRRSRRAMNLYPLTEQLLDERNVSSYIRIGSPTIQSSVADSIRGTGRSNQLRSSRMAVVSNPVTRAERKVSHY